MNPTDYKIHIVPVLKDNYVFVVEGKNKECLVIDPGEAQQILNFAKQNKLTITHILNTHHHWDHTDGNIEIKEKTNCTIVGPAYETIRGIDIQLKHADTWQWQDLNFDIFKCAGHTAGHIIYYCEALNAAFIGDVLFAMGCGRLFEGTASEAWKGFQHIINLPDDTALYCAHEYTVSNAKFALKHDPDNQDLIKRYETVKNIRRKKRPTIPTSVILEKQTNPFIRCGNAQAFAKLRKIRDSA